MKLALTGDVMLGRLVDQHVIRPVALPPETAWSDVLPLLQTADRRLINLECVISRRGQPWRPDTKAFHFRADPRAIAVLKAARIDGVTLANNHVLDYGADALAECLMLLDRAGIGHTGAGMRLSEALTPMLLDAPGGSVGVMAITDNEPEWEATRDRPGVQFVAFDDRGLIAPYRERVTQVLTRLRRVVRFVVVSAHVGPNWGRPSSAMRALAHQLLDLGADLYWGHSNHTPQAIELVGPKAALYSAGDFIDDYAVDAHERNDLSFLFMLEIEDGRMEGLRLYPVAIERGRVRQAMQQEAAWLAHSMQGKCAAFGTRLRFTDSVGDVVLP